MSGITVRPLAGAIGAEIGGIDLAGRAPDATADQVPDATADQVPDAATVAALRAAWLRHQVIFLRGQDLPPARLLAFARCFGAPVEYPFVRGIDGFPEIIAVTKLEHERHNFGGIWHSDTTYLPRPPMATMLIAREVPPCGGDTLFASQYAAYEALSDGLRATLDGLRAISSSAKADVSRTREDRMRSDGAASPPAVLLAEHPVVRTHPETGRRALYVNVAHTTHFVGWTEAESAPLLAWLHDHQTRPEFTCRFAWAPGSIALWDNRCVLHNPINDYHGYRRVMHRVTLAGDVPA